MEHNANSKPVLPRRKFLSQALGSAAFCLYPTLSNSGTVAGLHEQVAQHVKAVSNGNTGQLKILIPEGCGDNLSPVIAAFKELTSISVVPVETPVDDINMQLSLSSLSGEADYDLALPATFGIPDLVASNAIIPLTSYAEKYEPAGFRDDILFTIGDSFDGEFYGFQTDGDAYLMFYNRDFLENPEEKARYQDQFGVPLNVPLTWEELDRQMQFFHRPKEGLSGGLLFRTPGYLAWEWWMRFHAKGIWPLSRSLEPQIHSEAGISALEEMRQSTAFLAPEVSRLGLFDNWERFSQGDVYCNIGWGGTQKYLNSQNSKMRGRTAYGPTPGGILDDELTSMPYFNWGWNYVVTANSPKPELSYLFALFASTPEMSTQSVSQQGGYFDPFRTEHYEDPVVQNIYSKEFLDVHKLSMRASIPDLYLANQSLYFQTLSNWLDRALSGEVSSAQALERVAQHWTLINNRSDLKQQRTRWWKLRDKYPAALKAKLRDLS